jgi:hypothetical protein
MRSWLLPLESLEVSQAEYLHAPSVACVCGGIFIQSSDVHANEPGTIRLPRYRLRRRCALVLD